MEELSGIKKLSKKGKSLGTEFKRKQQYINTAW